MSKLVAVRIKQDNGSYSNEIPIGALTQNITYNINNTNYNLRQILGQIDMLNANKGSIQHQLDTLFNQFATYIPATVADAVSDWIAHNDPHWDGSTLDSTLSQTNQAAQAAAVQKVIAYGDEDVVAGTKLKINPNYTEINVLTTEDDVAYRDMITANAQDGDAEKGTAKAHSDYNIGEYIAIGTKLYKTITPISNNTTFIVGTNIEEVSLAESVNANTQQIATNVGDIADLKEQIISVLARNAQDITVPEGSTFDLNDLMTPGNYRVSTSANARRISNQPTNSERYRLIVMQTTIGYTEGANARLAQIAIINSTNGSKFAIRVYTGTWSEWDSMASASLVNTIKASLQEVEGSVDQNTNDIADLKEQISKTCIIDELYKATWSNGRIGTNGDFVSNSYDLSTQTFISVNAAKKLTIYIPKIPDGASNLRINIAEYTSQNKSDFIPDTFHQFRKTNGVAIMELNPNTKYIRVGIRASPNNTIILPDSIINELYIAYEDGIAGTAISYTNKTIDQYSVEWKQGQVSSNGTITQGANYSIYCELTSNLPEHYVFLANYGDIIPFQNIVVYKDADNVVLNYYTNIGFFYDKIPEGTSKILFGFMLQQGNTVPVTYGDKYLKIFGGNSETIFGLMSQNKYAFALFTRSRESIAEGTDFNTLTNIGNYRVTGSASSMINAPSTNRGFLLVFQTSASSIIYQVYFDNGGKIYYRFTNNSGTTFNVWNQIPTSENIKEYVNNAIDRYDVTWKQGRVNPTGTTENVSYSIYCELSDKLPTDYVFLANYGDITPYQTIVVYKDASGNVIDSPTGISSYPKIIPEGTNKILIGFMQQLGNDTPVEYGTKYLTVFGGSSETVFNMLLQKKNAFTLQTGIKEIIPDGTDFNTITATGNYRVTGSASSMINAPSTNRGFLLVFQTTADTIYYQVYFDNSGKIYYRYTITGGSTFVDWVKLITHKQESFNVDLEWAMKGFYTQFGSIGYSDKTEYRLSEPVKLYAGDVVKYKASFVINDIAVLKYFDRWNTYWASQFGRNKGILIPPSTGVQTLTVTIPETGYYIFSSLPTYTENGETHDAIVTVTRSAENALAVELYETFESWNYGQEKHNYVDDYDYAPDMTSRRTVSTLVYSGDDKKSSNYIANAVAYPDGRILACRAGGKIVLIHNDGTEEELKIERDGVMTTVAPNAQDWRGLFMDSNLNVYTSPHQTLTGAHMASAYRGLYKITYGTFAVSKVIDLCRSTTDIKLWTKSATVSYALDDIIFLDSSQFSDPEYRLRFYHCTVAHTHASGDSFDPNKWAVIDVGWTANTSYQVGDIIRYNSCYFWCASAHTSGARFDITKWDAATEHMDNDDTIWTVCEDEIGQLYAGVYSHSKRENASVYRLGNISGRWFYQYNFVWNGTLPYEEYGRNAVRHVHCINFNPYDNTLYAAVGEVNTLVKSTNHGTTWTDMHTPCYYGQPTYVMGVRDGLVIGSDGHYSCGVSKLMTDGKTMKKCGRTVPGFIFNIRRSDLTGWLYAWTRIDNIVQNSGTYSNSKYDRCPPIEAINDPAVLEEWKTTFPVDPEDPTNKEYEIDKKKNLQYWTLYNEWASKYYPEDAVRPQHCVIMVSRDEGDTWETIYSKKCATNYASFTGFTTVGYFRDGECLSGLEMPIEGTEDSFAYVQPVIISEGKKKRTADGFDLTGEIFIKTNSSSIVPYEE